MFGLGGVYVELFKDISFHLAPLTEAEALMMMQETKSSVLLTGFRGSSPLDQKAAAKTIVAVGELMCTEPQIQSLDINPLFIYPIGVMAVDVRIMLQKEPNNS
jgi:acyl-CoA synthetase (NDP forming)